MKISGIFLRHAALFMAATAVLAFSYFSSLRCSDLLQPDFGVRRSFSRFYKDEATGRAFKAVVTNIDDKKNLICREIYEYDPATSRRTKYTKEERFKDGKKLSIKEYDYLYDEDGDRSEFHVMVTQPGREGILKGTYRYDKRTGHVWNSRSVLSGKNGQVKSDRFFEYDKEERPVLIKKTFMDDAGNIAKNIEQKIEYNPATGKKLKGSSDITDGAGNKISHSEYTCDPQGRISKYVKVSGSGDRTCEYLYGYDGPAGNKVSFTRRVKDMRGKLLKEDISLYDRKSGLKRYYMSKEIEDGADVRESVVVYEPVSGTRKLFSDVIRDAVTGERVARRVIYDKTARIVAISERHFGADGKAIKTSEYIYAYDASSGKRRAHTWISKGSGGKVLKKENFTYDIFNDSVAEHLIAGFDDLGKPVYEERYRYDAGGNTVLRIVKGYGQKTGEAVEKKYKYGLDGKIAAREERRYDREGRELSVAELSYRYKDGADMKSETVLRERDIPGGMVREEVVRYDTNDGRKIRYAETLSEYDGRIRNKYECSFDSEGKVTGYTRAFQVDAAGESEESGGYQYDPQTGARISWEREIKDASGNETKLMTKYDKDTTSRKSYSSVEKSRGFVARELRYKYGELGRVESIYSLVNGDSGRTVSESETEYEYFPGTGVIERKEKVTRLPGERLTRKERYLFERETAMRKEYGKETISDNDGSSRAEESVYDKNGRIATHVISVRKSHEAESIVISKQTNAYDDKTGRPTALAKKETDPASGNGREELYIYDPVSGKTVKYFKKEFVGGMPVLDETYEYDAGNGRKLSYYKKAAGNKPGDVNETSEIYDVLGRLSSSTERTLGAGADIVYLNEYKYSYDDTTGKNVILVHRVVDNAGKTERSESYTFDPGSGNKTRYAVEEMNGKVLRRDTYLYDAATGVKDSYVMLEIDPTGDVTKGVVYKYDKSGKVTELSRTYPVKAADDVRLEEYVFRYDPKTGERAGYVRLGKDREGYILKEDIFEYSPKTGFLVRYAGTVRDKSLGNLRKESYDYAPETGKKAGYRVSATAKNGTEVAEEYKYDPNNGKMLSYSKVLNKKGLVVSDVGYEYDYDENTGGLAGYVRTERGRNGNVLNSLIFKYDKQDRSLFVNSGGGIVTNRPDYSLKYTKNGKPSEKALRLVEGLNEIAIDNGEGESVSVQVFLDTTPPVIDADPLAITNDPEYVLNYLVDGKPEQRVFVLKEGLNAEEFREKDAAGNESLYSFEVLLDTVPPDVKVVSPDIAGIPSYTLVYTVDGLEKTKQCVLEEGDNEILIRETDAAGNGTEVRTKVKLDSIPPVISAAPARLTNNPLYMLAYEVDGVPASKIINLKEGDNHIELAERDKAGNESVFPFDITLDSEPPLITATAPGYTNEPRINVEYTVDGGRKKDSFELTEGYNELSIRARDDAGNESVFGFNVVRDTDMPEGRVKVRASDGRGSALTIDPFAEDDTTAVTGWRYNMDNADWSGWLKYPPSLSDRTVDIMNPSGEHIVNVEFRDAAGNVSGASCRTGAGPDSGGEDIGIEIKDKVYEYGGENFLGNSNSMIKDILDVVFLKGATPSGTVVEFRISNGTTREEWVTPVVFPIKTCESFFDVYACGRSVKRAVRDGDRISVSARIAGTDSSSPGKWSDPQFFIFDDNGPEVEAVLRRGAADNGQRAVFLDLYANDDGSDVWMWRSKVNDRDWSYWKIYPSPSKERGLDFGDIQGAYEVESEVMDRVMNTKKSRASIIF